MYSTCIHCGLCLEQCPTYRVLGLEADSPRGRIYQILQVDQGNLAIADSFVTHIDRCLGCLACQTACPSGVNYGHIVERARAEIEQNYRRPLLARLARRYTYKKLLTNFRVLAFWAKLLRFYQRSGLQKTVRESGVLKSLGLEKVEALSPQIDDRFSFDDLGKTFPAEGEQRARVAFLIGCIASVSFAELNRATIRVLQKNGVTVYVPPQQSCCGALHAHAGFRDDARDLARKNIDAMLAENVDAVITNAAGCGSMMKEYGDLLAHDPCICTEGEGVRRQNKRRERISRRTRTTLASPENRGACHLPGPVPPRARPEDSLCASRTAARDRRGIDRIAAF